MIETKFQKSSKWVHNEIRGLISLLTDYTANGSFADLANNVTYINKKDYARLVRLTDIRNEFKAEGVWVNEDSYNYLVKSKLYGDEILIANVGAYAGHSFMFNKNFSENATLGPNMFLIKFKNNISNKLFYYLLNEPYLANQLISKAISSAQPKLNKENVRSCMIFYPEDISEQERIATALSDIDDLISSMRKLIEKKKNIKTGVMQELLSGKKRLKGFLGDWKEEYLGKIADLYQPHTIGGNCFTNYGFDVYGANGIIGKYSSYNHETDQVLITCRGNTCGNINYSKGKCWINGNAMVVNMDNYDICKRFIYYYLTFQDFSSVISGSGQPQITRKPLNELKLFIPPTKAEQEAIAKVLSDMDAEIEQLEMRLTKYEDIKQGMMQQLLTGKIRLI